MQARFLPLAARMANDYYRSPKYNLDSAEAVYAVFFGPYSDKVKNAPLFCGNGGLCGAVYAAADIRPDLEDIICQEFQHTAKECTCDDIIGHAALPCHQCVQLACELLEDYLVPVYRHEEKLWWEHDPEGVERRLG